MLGSSSFEKTLSEFRRWAYYPDSPARVFWTHNDARVPIVIDRHYSCSYAALRGRACRTSFKGVTYYNENNVVVIESVIVVCR